MQFYLLDPWAKCYDVTIQSEILQPSDFSHGTGCFSAFYKICSLVSVIIGWWLSCKCSVTLSDLYKLFKPSLPAFQSSLFFYRWQVMLVSWVSLQMEGRNPVYSTLCLLPVVVLHLSNRKRFPCLHSLV